MKKIKVISLAFLCCVPVLAVLIFGREILRPDADIIGIVPQWDSAEYQRILEGLKETAKENGFQILSVIPEEQTVQSQKTAILRLLDQGADSILVEAVAEGGFQEVLDETVEKNVPVLSYNSRINSSDIYAEILPYPIESAADAMLEVMNKKTEENPDQSGQFCVISTTSQDFLREARTRQMLNYLEEGRYPGLRLTGSGFVKEDISLAKEKARQFDEKYPDLSFVICYSTAAALGISESMESDEISWNMVCEGSVDDLKGKVSDGTVILTYDYEKYGDLLASLAVYSVKNPYPFDEGELFTDVSGNTYAFQNKWEYGEKVDGASDHNALYMQTEPEIVIAG